MAKMARYGEREHRAAQRRGTELLVPVSAIEEIAPFAGALGKRGGRARTPAKIAAARKNGPKGGRPRKHASSNMKRHAALVEGQRC